MCTCILVHNIIHIHYTCVVCIYIIYYIMPYIRNNYCAICTCTYVLYLYIMYLYITDNNIFSCIRTDIKGLIKIRMEWS